MKTTLIALCLFSLAAPALASEKINPLTEKVPTYKAQLDPHAQDHYTIHTQVTFKNGKQGEVQVHGDDYRRVVKFEHLTHAEAAQVDLMKKLEEVKQRHNEEHFEEPHRQIAVVDSWLEKTTINWTTTERVRD